MIHQAWSDGSFFPVSNHSARQLVEPGARLIWTVEAASWVEAMRRYNDFRGWEPYRPLDDDPGEYSAEEERDAGFESNHRRE